MATNHFTHTDYFSASLTRYADLAHLRTNTSSAIFSVYTAGVSIECMFRAYITKYTKEFDAKHDLEKLFIKSLLGSKFDIKQKEQLTIAVKKANQIWANDMRYASEKRMKRLIAHKNIRAGLHDVNKYIERYFKEIFEATDLIIAKGHEKWT
ncbi:hypothetical protein H8S95_01005 [Pontibacter sp. KCTC 32443]|uniref:hypothetical protein n=1 Tax=Pontibacter TaxID=323449 RepID=UPI00164ED2EE|nr:MULTISPECIES: hypothetical protein [Pontibacter]MBC5772625.1 hypothetical protein [Pontibacter sp. KCTC 32443]